VKLKHNRFKITRDHILFVEYLEADTSANRRQIIPITRSVIPFGEENATCSLLTANAFKKQVTATATPTGPKTLLSLGS